MRVIETLVCPLEPNSSSDSTAQWKGASMLLVATASFLGTLLPLLLAARFATSGLAFQSAKLFGAGIVLSTALIHMLTMANETLRKPCLEPLLGAYPPLANLSALIGTLLTHWVQVVVHQGLSSLVSMEQRKYHHHPAPHDHEGEDHTHHNHQNDAPQLGHLHHHSIESSDSLSQHAQESEPLLLSPAVVLAIGQPTFKDENCVHSEEHTELILDGGHDHSHGGALIHSNHFSAYLLEVGVAIHSVIVGIAFGVAQTFFSSLLIALLFHQFFEGIALSAIITEARVKNQRLAFFMVGFYALTTPLGIAIGMLLHHNMPSNHATVLIVQGILDGVASGILFYDSLVNIIVPHFNGNNFRHGKPWRQAIHFACLWLGAICMSLVGIWI